MTPHEIERKLDELQHMQGQHPEELLHRALELADAASALDLQAFKARAQVVAASAALRMGEHARAMDTLAAALPVLEQERAHTADAAEGYLLRSQASFLRNEAEDALRYAHRARELADIAGDPALGSRALNSIGLVYGSMGAFTLAAEHFGESVRMREEQSLTPLGGPLNNLGNIYLLQDEPRSALDAFEAALLAFEVGGSHREIVIALGNVGRALTAVGEHDRAVQRHHQAVRHAQDHGVADYDAPSRAKLGRALAAAGDLEGAQRWLCDALQRIEAGSEAFREETIHALADVALEQGDLPAARRWADALLQIAGGVERPQLSYDAHALASRVHELAGEFPEALDHLKRAEAWRKRVDRELFSSKTRALQLQLDVERSERERDLLREANTELSSAYEELTEVHETLQERTAELHRLSLEDPLTGLHNRRALEQRWQEERKRIERYGGTFSLLVCDIDDFKDTNDRLSHAVGDRVLERLGRILRTSSRDVDIAARVGGEEFVILLPETNARQAHVVGENVRAAVATHAWDEVHEDLDVTVSIGVAEASPGGTFDEAFRRADSQLYVAKRAGKNRVHGPDEPLT